MEEQLYLFEVLVDEINFEDAIGEIPTKKQLIITVSLGSIATLEIRSETLPLKGGEASNKRHIDFKCGKSYLCSFSPDNLLDALERKSIEIVVGIKGDVQPISTTTIPWNDTFRDLIAESKDVIGFLTPAIVTENCILMNNDTKKGNLQLFLRLSCFGTSLQTQFEINLESGNKQFIFKSPYMMTTFTCTRYGTGDSTDFLPVSPMYTITSHRGESQDKTTPSDQSVSWTALPKSFHPDSSYRSSTQSECLFPEYLNITPAKTSTLTFDIVSLIGRPEEDKFIDFNTGRRISDPQDPRDPTIHSDDLSEEYNQLDVDREIDDKLQKTYIYNELFGSFEEKYNLYADMLPIEEQHDNFENYWTMKQEEDVYQQSTNHLLRLRGGALTKSPLAECEEVMEQFDKILREYRNALSPCGQIGCNFAPNIVETTCNQTCYNVLDTGISTNGCGYPECEYYKYKSSLIPLDLDIEKQFIGPAIIGNCGHPKCPYQIEPTLPPIHWECPEPLPAGKCTNPNCPYPSNDLPYHTRLSTTKGPCGSNECPYLPPAACSSPNCPFRTSPPCASAKEALHNRKEQKERKKNDTKTFATCPFSNPPTIINVMQLCDNPDCDVMKRAMQSGDCTTRAELCNSPNCPVKSVRKKCSNPECPFTKSDLDSACSNPDCPLNGGSAGSCSNPNCPFNKSSTELTQFSSEATQERSNQEEENVEPEENEKPEACGNTECPFNAASIESCKNPECPYKEEKPIFQESKESCDNPECPFKQGSQSSEESHESECECENPLCPSKRETCLNPNCPFNLRGYDTCRNPDCPHRKYAHGKDLGYCSTPSPSFNEMCADKTCPFYDPKTEETQNRMDVGVGKSMAKIGNLIIQKGPLEVAVGNRPSVYDAAPCGLKTCKFMGGQLECADCSVGTEGRRRGPCPKTCPGDPVCPLATERKLRRAGKRRVPLFKRLAKQGKKPKMECTQVYPGYKIGHRECCVPYFFVPPKMGWLWNIHTPCLNLKPRRGWRPGAITRTVAKAIIKHHKEQNNYPFENNQKKKRKRNEDSEPKLICPKPTLEVKKKEGAYFITMNPLKDPSTLQQNENPYLDVTPMQFKVERNNALDPDCICHDEGEYYKSDCSSDSEFEIEVTTPAGIIHPDRPIKKKEVVVQQTQYDRRDIPPAEKGKGGKKKKKGKKGKKGKKNKKKKK